MPIVKPEECIACGICVNECPVNAIVWKDGKAFIKQDVCIKCGYCVTVCPVNAIKPD